MQYSRESTAYDLSKFERKQEKKPQIRVIKGKKAQRVNRVAIVKIFFAAVIVIGITSLMIVNRVALTEIGEEINAANEDLQILQSENTRLNVELEEKMSLDNIEEKAVNELGLTKMNNYQVQYLNLTQEDKIELTNPKSSGNIFDTIAGWFDKIKEYLS